jgi:hypothetical protein
MLIETLSKRVFWGPVTTIPDADDYPKMTTTLRGTALRIILPTCFIYD